ncbi:hypothetical protein GCM10011492_10110 [Flexivirga endophytica]|uniref:Sugar O-methyltransferase n=1 Tax=Flexivirga endophytica TaxID=1849103 RepID=A0A916WRB2_9MICO|nr:putative sugar O-methyltransferase [Flexivirga endophytica]GGB22301.1 hypothetical protein GCM10011492_10110 [Flexivirga endophytica]GHB56250.1 hypothetical protein GCM10008112_26650 [Flexivirga endophytica]
MTDHAELTNRTLDELRVAPERYRPTNFWGPGVDALLGDLERRGLETFKSWPSAAVWFNPYYGDGWTDATMAATYETVVRKIRPTAKKHYFVQALNGSQQARRDYDVACVGWDQQRWPFDLASGGESTIGKPWQRYGAERGTDFRFGRAYANYLLCLSALSRHVDTPPRSFLELGGGFGVLGEIVTSRDPGARYVDLDIPPLLSVATYYLESLLGAERVTSYDQAASAPGPIHVPQSGVLPNYRIEDLDAEFEVFVNSFSFQEMEPDVVDHYIDQVCAKGIRYAVSLNSRAGKPRAANPGDWGALEPVTSANIIEMFATRGLELVGSYDAPYVRGAGQLNVFRRQAD